MKKLIELIKKIIESLKNTKKGASLLWFRDVKSDELNEYE
jgi:hypothetical protein